MNQLNNLKSLGERLRRMVRSTVPMSLYAQCSGLLDASYGIKAFGLREYRKLSSLRSGSTDRALTSVHLRPFPHAFYIRPGAPDADLILHAVAREAYAFRLPDEPVRLIVDAGANIGDTTIWYANRFPASALVAIEPNPSNFNVLAKNCAPYGSRIRLIKGALWPAKGQTLAITGRENAAQVRLPTGLDDSTCTGVDPLTILSESGRDAIDLFKIDIEGAELALFSGDCDSWLSRTRNIAIEIHSQEAFTSVLSATKRNGFNCSAYRDIYVFWK